MDQKSHNSLEFSSVKKTEAESSKQSMRSSKIDNRPKKRKPGFHKEMFEETSYYFQKGLRYVYPYPFTFVAHVKQRWLNLRLIDLFKKEFHMETVEYYKEAIKAGKIRVNNEVVSEDRILTSKDILYTGVHRHEPPVIHEEIEFLQNDDDMVVINKPSSLPVHPCGRYRHNTIVFLLGKEHQLNGLHTIHRIDRLTSGILMFAKTPAMARTMEQAVKGRRVEKEYLARVVGEFPSDEITVDEPILTMSHKVGVCQVHADGKPCSTTFKQLNYNGKSSVVSCKPHTGRMHQIRVHLQYIGHPIINDPIYNHKTAWGEEKGKRGSIINMDEVIAELIRTRKDKSYDDDLNCVRKDESYDNNLNSKDDLLVPVKKRKIDVSDVNEKCSKIEQNSSNVDDDLLETNINKELFESNKIEKHGGHAVEKHEGHMIESDQNTKDVKEEVKELIYKEEKEINKELKNKNVIETVNCNKETDGKERVSYTSLDIGEAYFDKDCTECKRSWIEPYRSELVMYLHALNYKGPGWEYKTKSPKWSEEDWSDDVL